MPCRLAQLSPRRRALALESQAPRAQLGESADALRQALRLVRVGRAVLDGMPRHPGLAIGAAATALRARRVWLLAALGGRALALMLRVAALVPAALSFVQARGGRAAPHR